MSKQAGRLARRYARALLSAVHREHGSAQSSGLSPAQEIAESLTAFAEIWKKDDSLRTTMLNPMFEKNERSKALQSIAEKAGASAILIRFLKLVFEKDRIAVLPEIAESFTELADTAADVVRVEVIVASEVPEGEAREIESSLSQHIAGNLEFDWQLDQEILGGLLVKYQGKVLDGSLQGRIQRIEQRLLS